ncbi:MAG: hypothetical protein HRU27_03625 [Rhizobiaceae bacterium]|nr:hypothetical protein [Hyphomicrobiales bacterium]NRB29669.1 hypothetical protein [Rhizobiaceae bacterium]
MFAFELLLSPAGRMKRLNYVLLSGFIGAMNFGLLALVGLQSGASPLEILEGGPLFLFQASPVLAAVALLGIWIQVCFVFKRSRDFSGGTLAAWLFVAFWGAPYLAPYVLAPGSGFGPDSMLKFASAVPAAIVGLVLFFADSKDDTLVAKASGDNDQGSVGFGDLDEGTDLVARAAALRAVETPPPLQADINSASTQTAPTGRPAQTGFGRRKSFAN